MNTAYKNNIFLVVALAAILSFGFVQTAHAQDYGGYDYTPVGGGYDYGYNGGCCDYGYDYTPVYSGYDYTPVDSGYDYTPVYSGYDYTPVDSGYDYTPVYSGYDYTPVDGGYSYVPDNYSYSSGSSFSLGGGYGGYGGYYGGYSYPYYSYGGYGGGGYTNINTNSNYAYTYNSCVGTDNCNTVNTNINNPTPTVTYTSPSYSYPSYPSYSYSQPYSYTPPVIISASGTTNPYISLSSIPYTGLELGFWGTIAYWSFLILWCLFAAYLIVVKRVHSKFMNFLFGSKQEIQVTPAQMSSMPQQDRAAVRQNRSDELAQALTTSNQGHDAIDSFIMAQIQNRARA